MQYPAFKAPGTVQVKIDRAAHHIADLRAQIDAVFHPGCCTFSFDVEPDPNGFHVMRVDGLPDIRAEWSAIAGDALFNLRSGLDHLAGVLVRAHGGEPNSNTKFPIYDRPPTAKGGSRTRPTIKPDVGEQVREELERVQPYVRYDFPTSVTAEEAQRKWLSILSRLNIIDKHRTLLVVRCALDLQGMYWGSNEGELVPELMRVRARLEDGGPVAWWDFHGESPDPAFDSHSAVAVCLDEEPLNELMLTSVADYLEALHQNTLGLVQQFMPFV